MNEILFFIHCGIILACTFGALRLGKTALSLFFILQVLLANLFVIKQTSLFGLAVTTTDVFILGCMLSLNLLREYFGQEAAKRAFTFSLFAFFFFALMAKMHLFYQPHPLDSSQSAFEKILSHSPRIFFASIFTFFIVQKVDLFLYHHLLKRFGKKHLPLRMGSALFLSQGLDTIFFSFLGLYGIVYKLGDVMLMSFFIKCITLLLMVPFTAFAKYAVKEEFHEI